MKTTVLRGRTILVTRAVQDATTWAQRIAAHGARPVVMPCLHREPLRDSATLADLRRAVAVADWLLFTSPYAATVAGETIPANARIPDALHFGVIGRATAIAVRKRFGRVDLVASAGTGAALARDLLAVSLRSPAESRVAIAGAMDSREELPAALRAAGVEVTCLPLYRTIPEQIAAERRQLATEGIDVILLASPSAVTGLMRIADVPTSAQIITIGPTTSSAARAAGLTVAAEAARPTLDAMLDAIR